MGDAITRAIETVLAAEDAPTYLAAQDGAIGQARAQYDRLREVARNDERAAVRWEALQLVSLVQAPDHRQVLEAALQEDEDPGVRECAKALVFRSIVTENIRQSGKLNAEGMRAYETDVRFQAARRLFSRTTTRDDG